MSALLVVSLLTGVVGIHLEEAVDVPNEVSIAVLQHLAESAARFTCEKPLVDDPIWASCTEGARCLDDARARLGATHLLVVRIFKGPLAFRVAIEFSLRSASVDVPKDPSEWQWGQQFGTLTASVFRERCAHFQIVPSETPAPPEKSINYLPWVLAGTAVAGTTLSIYFGANAGSTRDEIERAPLGGAEFGALDDRLGTQRTLSNIFLGTALLAAGTAVGLWLID